MSLIYVQGSSHVGIEKISLFCYQNCIVLLCVHGFLLVYWTRPLQWILKWCPVYAITNNSSLNKGTFLKALKYYVTGVIILPFFNAGWFYWLINSQLLAFMTETQVMELTSFHNSRIISMAAPWKHIALSQVYFNNKTFGNFNNEAYLRPFTQ